MKKNVFTILLALALVLSCVFVAAPAAYAEETTAHTHHCYCVNAAEGAVPETHVCEESATWTELTSSTTIVDGGHYYLNGDLAKAVTVSSDITITICLNGYTLKGQRPLVVSKGNVNICDCKGTGKMHITSFTTSSAGAPIYVSSSSGGAGTVNLYSGIIRGIGNNNVKTRAVVVKGGTFNMYGGSIVDGGVTAETTTNSVASYAGYGGNVLVFRNGDYGNGTFNMYGGTISGGSASANGGNVYVEAGVFNMEGGTITGGSAANGANIATNGNGRKVELTISGGVIENGVATEKGGNIYLQNTTNGTAFQITDGAVTGGKAVNGGNLYVDGNNPSTVTGGAISMGEASENGGNIYVDMGEGKVFTLNGVTVSGGSAGKTVTEETNAETGETITVTSYSGRGGNIYVNTGDLKVTAGAVSDGAANNGGNIWSASALTLGEATVSGGKAQGNGGNILIDKKALTLNGTTVSGGQAGNNGGNIVVTGTGSQLYATDAIIENGTAVSGGNIYTLNAGTVEITNGSVTGGNATNGGNLYSTHSTMTATRKLTINGTTVSNGTAEEKGGNLYIAKVGVVKLENVTCDNGIAKTSGGNVYMEGNFNVTFTGGTYSVADGGRKYTYTYPEGSEATEEEKAEYIAKVAAYGLNNASTKLVADGGKRLNENGGNICIAWATNKTTETTSEETGETTTTTTPNSTVFKGTTILGGNAQNGGCLYVNNANVTATGLIAKSCGGASGRVLHISKSAVVTVTDSTLVNWGTAGSAVYNAGSLTLTGEVKFDKEFNASERNNGSYKLTTGILLDTVEYEAAIVDISGLTQVVNREEEGLPTVYGISMTRYGSVAENDTKLAAAGKLATGINDTNESFVTIANTAFVLIEDNGDLYMNNAAIQGIKADGAITNGGANFPEITANHKVDVLYYIVNENIENAGELGISIILDLNGKNITGASVAAGKTLQLMDNQNDNYDETKCGTIQVTGDIDPITHIVPLVGNRHYVALTLAENIWTAHRYLAYITDTSLAPNQDALGFKATFYCDAYAQQVLQGVGYQMSVADNAAKDYVKEEFVFEKNKTSMYLRVKNIMKNNGGEMKITGNPILVFNINGETVYADTSAKATTMKQTIRAVNGLELNDIQKAAVYNLYKQYEAVMSGWFTAEETNNIASWAPTEATA